MQSMPSQPDRVAERSELSRATLEERWAEVSQFQADPRIDPLGGGQSSGELSKRAGDVASPVATAATLRLLERWCFAVFR